MSRWNLVIVCAIAVLSPALPAEAQSADPGPEHLHNRNSDAWQQMLDCSDEEWTAIEPRLEKVLFLRAQPYGPLRQRYHELRHLVKHDARAELILEKLQEFRQARAEADLLLAQSEADLRQILTVRQEAQLVMMGVIE